MAAIAACLFLAGRSPRRHPNSWVARHPVARAGLGIVPTAALVTVVVIDPLSLGGDAPFPHEETVLRGPLGRDRGAAPRRHPNALAPLAARP